MSGADTRIAFETYSQADGADTEEAIHHQGVAQRVDVASLPPVNIRDIVDDSVLILWSTAASTNSVSLLNGIIQGVQRQLSHADNQRFAPSTLALYRCFDVGSTDAHVYIWPRISQHSAQHVHVDVDVIDSQSGHIVAQLHGLQLAHMLADAPLEQTQTALEHAPATITTENADIPTDIADIPTDTADIPTDTVHEFTLDLNTNMAGSPSLTFGAAFSTTFGESIPKPQHRPLRDPLLPDPLTRSIAGII